MKDIKEEEIVILSESINTVRRDSSVPVHFRQPGSSINSARRQQQQLLTVTPASTAMQYINAISAMTQSLPTMGPSSLYHGSGATVVQYGGAPAYQQYAPSLLPALVQPLGGYITLQPPPPPTIYYNNSLYSVPYQQQQPAPATLVSAAPYPATALFHAQPLVGAAYAAATHHHPMPQQVLPSEPPRLTPEVTLLHSSGGAVDAPAVASQQPPPQPQRKIARVQPTPQVVRPIPTKASPNTNPTQHRFTPPAPSPTSSVHRPTPSPTGRLGGVSATPTPPPVSKYNSILARPKLDPMKALTSLSRNPVSSSSSSTTTSKATDLLSRWKSEQQPATSSSQRRPSYTWPSVMAATATPLNLSQPPSQSYIGPSIIDLDSSRPETPTICVDDDDDDCPDVLPTPQPDDFDDDDYNNEETLSSPEPPEPGWPRFGVKSDGGGINVTTKPSRTNSIRIVLQRENPSEDYSIREVLIKDGSKATADGGNGGVPAIEPKSALQALKIKARISKKLDSKVFCYFVFSAYLSFISRFSPYLSFHSGFSPYLSFYSGFSPYLSFYSVSFLARLSFHSVSFLPRVSFHFVFPYWIFSPSVYLFCIFCSCLSILDFLPIPTFTS